MLFYRPMLRLINLILHPISPNVHFRVMGRKRCHFTNKKVNIYISVSQNERSPNNGAAYTPVESNWTHRNTQRSLKCFNCKWNIKKKENLHFDRDFYHYCLLLALKGPFFSLPLFLLLSFSRLKFPDINISVKTDVCTRRHFLNSVSPATKSTLSCLQIQFFAGFELRCIE